MSYVMMAHLYRTGGNSQSRGGHALIRVTPSPFLGLSQVNNNNRDQSSAGDTAVVLVLVEVRACRYRDTQADS